MADQRPERPNRKSSRQSPNQSGGTGKRLGKGLFGWVLFIGLVMMLIVLVKNQQTNKTSVAYSDFFRELKKDNVQNVTIEGSEANGEFVHEITGETGPVKKFRVKLATDQPVM